MFPFQAGGHNMHQQHFKDTFDLSHYMVNVHPNQANGHLVWHVNRVVFKRVQNIKWECDKYVFEKIHMDHMFTREKLEQLYSEVYSFMPHWIPCPIERRGGGVSEHKTFAVYSISDLIQICYGFNFSRAKQAGKLFLQFLQRIFGASQSLWFGKEKD